MSSLITVNTNTETTRALFYIFRDNFTKIKSYEGYYYCEVELTDVKSSAHVQDSVIILNAKP
jgi:hypothetical protein